MIDELPDLPEEAPIESVEPDDQYWLDLSNRAYDDSTTYLNAGLRGRWERNYALAASRHPSGSKYYSDQYKHRSKIFRGKTASAIRRNMAACAVALFSTQEVVSIEADDENNQQQVDAAKAAHELSNYYLDGVIPWFLVVQGAYREALTVGVVASKQWWEYEEISDRYSDGGIKVITDKPIIELFPPENVRISPAANWLDPVNSSPYVILLLPMYVGDVKKRCKEDWIPKTDEEIEQAVGGEPEFDSIRRAREGNKPDSKAERVSVSDHDIAWVRECFVRDEGEEYVYYTLGRSILLSDPMPLRKAYPHCRDNKRPVKFGVCDIEPHTLHCQGLPERVEGCQVQANDIANQRNDNVQLVLNRRHYAKRGANIDTRALMKSIPGAVILTDDIAGIKPEVMPDVTASSYQEQNLINMDFDELSGTFSTASVATNRQLNETVGGMQLLSGNSNILAEYQLRIFVESWVEPVLKELVEMIKTYADDKLIASVSGKPEMNRAALDTKINVRVNVGFGATDPQQKVQKLIFGISALANIVPNLQTVIDSKEISAEVFGALGWKDGARFVPGLNSEGNPAIEQLQQQVQQLTQQLETKMAEKQVDLEIAQFKAGADQQLEAQKAENDKALESMKQQTAILKIASTENMKMADIKAMLEGKEVDLSGQRVLKGDELKSKIYMEKAVVGEKAKAGGFFEG